MATRILFALCAALASFSAGAATKYFVTADVVRGGLNAQGAVCVSNSVFLHGEQLVWRAIVFDAATQQRLTEEQVKQRGVRVSVVVDNGMTFNMRFGNHPPKPRPEVQQQQFWSFGYAIPDTAPVGTLKWTVAVVDNNNDTGSFTPIGQDSGLNLLTIVKPAPPKTSAVRAGLMRASYSPRQ